MSNCILVFKAGQGREIFAGFSVGMAVIKLTNDEILTCKALTLRLWVWKKEQHFQELVLFMHVLFTNGRRHFQF